VELLLPATLPLAEKDAGSRLPVAEMGLKLITFFGGIHNWWVGTQPLVPLICEAVVRLLVNNCRW